MYRDPLGGHAVVVAALPIEQVEPTPYQRDRSEAHVKKLANAMERVDRFLDPLIAVRRDGTLLDAERQPPPRRDALMGMKSITALVLPEEDVALQILALNTEKAHNLKERSLEVIRMYRGLVGGARRREGDRLRGRSSRSRTSSPSAPPTRSGPRFSAGAYSSIVKRLERSRTVPLDEGLPMREARADRLLALDDAVARWSRR